jgi:endo-1,4-beta-xylanase
MSSISRRKFLKTGALGTAGLAAAPLISSFPKGYTKITSGEMVFKPYPNLWMPKMEFAYAADVNEDPFKSSMEVTKQGVVIPEDFGDKKFSVNTRWFVDGFGFIYLAADNGGQFYSLDDIKSGKNFNLNYEFAKSRIIRNRSVKVRYEKEGTVFSKEVNDLVANSEEFFETAGKFLSDGQKAAGYADKSLNHALWAGEKIELERARAEIIKNKIREAFQFGCETRQYVWVKSEEFVKQFPKNFDFATITHYVWDSWYELFEPREGYYNWGIKDDILNFLERNNITVEGRPLFWFHPTVTPDWLKEKSFDELKKYVEKHTHDLVSHYGDRILQWEVINEYHDWANIFNNTPEQITEIVRLACDKTKEVNPKVTRILNNCCPWAEYAAWGRMARMEATRPLRSPRKYLEDLINAGVDFDVVGIQIYFPRRDLSDIVRLLERLEKFNKPIYITEMGATSGPTKQTIEAGSQKVPEEPYEWHRNWDEELQADWLEQVYTIYYSRKSIASAAWYDFADFRPFIVDGGLVREDCSAKRSFNRLNNLLGSWGKLPKS